MEWNIWKYCRSKLLPSNESTYQVNATENESLSLVDENDEQDARPQRFDQLRLCDEIISPGGDFCIR